ncbi:MAG TPA: T9SS type A sorting domain-containing protein, partial [Bacteroidales bacterium]|nr:T9SS type A sorting domain-containing protein [Bacteroidales bacterium]
TQWQWDFPGGEPSASTDKNPVVRYPDGGRFDVNLTVAGNGGTGTIRKKEFIRVKPSVGIQTITPFSNDFVVYPNPARNMVTIENKRGVNAGANLEIFDRKGTRMVNLRIADQKVQLNVEKFSPGLYLFLITADHSTQKIKVIVL